MGTKQPLFFRAALAYLVACVALFFYASAFASTGSSSGWALVWLVPYVPVVIPILSALQAIVARELADEEGFWHTAGGHVLLTVFGAALGAGVSFLSAGNFTKSALVAALAGAASAFAGAWKTGTKATAGKLAIPTPPKPPLSAAALMPILFLPLFLGLAGVKCSLGAQALGACELGKLPATLEAIVATVVAIAANPNSTEQDLVSAGEKVAPDQFGCAVTAVSAWIDSQVPTHGQMKPEYVAMQAKLKAYLAQHPVKGACADWPSAKGRM